MFSGSVPCNGCTACCVNDLVFLHPEQGDDPAAFDTVESYNPLTGEQGLALRHKDEGGCVYLGHHGCSIHGRAPAVCKAFDCREFYRDIMSLPRNRRRILLKKLRTKKLASNEVLLAGKQRLGTLHV